MLSILQCPILSLFLIVWLAFGLQSNTIASQVKLSGQLLDCTELKATGTNRIGSSCTGPKNESSGSIHETPRQSSDTPKPTQTFSINFNNILKRREANEIPINCTDEDVQTTNVICIAKNQTITKPISINIIPNITDQLTIGSLTLKPNTTNVIQCQFSLSPWSNVTELDFKLRWLRSITSQHGLNNQSISSGPIDNSLHQSQHSIFVSASQVSTAQRQGGLDLLLNDATSSDSGDYFCQAVAGNDSILDEKRIHLEIHDSNSDSAASVDHNPPPLHKSRDRVSFTYSDENLEKLLPSLHVVPDYIELATGESIQLACVTKGLDPDPDPDKIEWTFEPFERPGYVPTGVTLKSSLATADLPSETTQIGNILIVWSMSHETIGVYKCSYHLEEMNLTAEASGEIALRPNFDMAPSVYITPELLRLSAKGSAKIQCESTGYPPPEIEWFRVDVSSNSTESLSIDANKETPQQSSNKSLGSLENLDGLEVKKLQSQDVMAHCIREGCRALNNLEQPVRDNQRQQDDTTKPKTLVTGLSWIQINQARASHQGHYVCKATNKHGTHQASSIIDVEFKDSPQVEIAKGHTSQIIVLDEQGTVTQTPNVEFNCSIKAGQPKPQLKWLRMSRRRRQNILHMSNSVHTAGVLNDYEYSAKGVSATGSQSDLEVYDLTTVSSATSRVSTQSYNDNTTLVLQLSTISIDDEGDYVCLGENEVGRHSAVAQLQVRRRPEVKISPASPKIFRPNESFQLDCIVTGHPVPIDIEWSRTDRGAFFAFISRHVPTAKSDQERAILRFDRVTDDDAGEYACAARDPINPTIVFKDTIMLMIGDNSANSTDDSRNSDLSKLIPKLLVRPTKIAAEIGSNVSLDCLAVSGLQPTIVEWLAPSTALTPHSESLSREHTPIRPYYRNQVGPVQDVRDSSLLQFGSRLRLFNVSKAHQGVYQCKGKNRLGVENAPAFVEIIERSSTGSLRSPYGDDLADEDKRGDVTKTKIAKMGTNIELRCQVSGADRLQLATSWSRENRELPSGSVQIGNNLWLQNLTDADNGLYLCSARSNEPNEILQAKIRLLVNEDERLDGRSGEGKFDPTTLNARIIPSKVQLVEGDSVTLECVISSMDAGSSSSTESNHPFRRRSYSANDLADLERQVIWTNLQSGQSLFQDNVYIQGNLLIIYGLKRENSATYRCNYNDLTQHTDYNLMVSHNRGEEQTSFSNGQQQDPMIQNQLHEDLIQGNLTSFLQNNYQLRHVIAPVGSRRVLECKTRGSNETHNWTSDFITATASNIGGNLKTTRNITGTQLSNLTLDHIDTDYAGVYQCFRRASLDSSTELDSRYLVEVPVVAAKFVQKPVSFITLPAVSDADHRLEIELKFYPENDHGLMLFSGGLLNNLIDNQNQFEPDLSNKTITTSSIDYISLGLMRGHLEFRFELGDGTTLVRSSQPIGLNRWHKILIERSRRSASMWLNGQAVASNTSAGKFFNLNLDSLLYVGGHQVFLSSSGKRLGNARSHGEQNSVVADSTNQTKFMRTFYGFSHGFRGCISALRINQRDLNLMDRNRSVTVGIFECDKSECPTRRSLLNDPDRFECNPTRGLCQVDRLSVPKLTGSQVAKRLRSHPNSDLRCICYPNFRGASCNESSLEPQSDRTKFNTVPTPVNADSSKELAVCNTESGCNPNGTLQCELLSSTSYRCHCRIGFMGGICDQLVTFDDETSVGFNQSAFIQFAFRPFHELISLISPNASQGNSGLSMLNELDYSKSVTFTEQQNITFRVKTRASYGLLFYIGQDWDRDEMSSLKIETNVFQASKSIVANLLSRLTQTKVGDFLAVALVDGHIELSYELGSGLAVLRSSKRYNDGLWHKIEVLRKGKASRLILDESSKHEIKSPGKLSMLNVGQDIYLGGLPDKFLRLLSASSSSSTGLLLSTFMGCLSDLHINSLGPINLVQSDRLTQLKSGRNLVASGDALLLVPQKSGPISLAVDDKIAGDRGPIKSTTATASTTTTTTMAAKKTTKRPTKPSYTTTESYGDDSDELASSS